MFGDLKKLCLWLISCFYMQIIVPAVKFYQNYPVINGNSNICAYLRQQNESIYFKHLAFTVGFSTMLFVRFTAKLLSTGSMIMSIKDHASHLSHFFLRLCAMIYMAQFKNQIKSTLFSHDIEVQRKIRLKLHITTISRIISNEIMSLDSIYGNPELGISVNFGWVMGLIDTLITALWFIDAKYMKVLVLLGHNAFYCILSSTVHIQFQMKLMEKIMVPCLLLSILAISYESNVKSNFILSRQVKEQKIVYEKFLERVQDPIIICDKKHIIFSNKAAKESFGIANDLFLENLDKLETKSRKSLSEELKERLSRNECNFDAVEVKYFLYGKRQSFDLFKPENVYMVTIVESDFFSRSKTVSLILRDITLEIEQEEKRFKDRLRDMVLYSLAHELRTPLNFLQDVFDLAKPAKVLKNNKERYDNSKCAWNYLRNKINDTLTYAQILSGEFEIHNSAFDFKKFVKQLKKMSKFLLHDKRDKLKFNFKIDLGTSIPNDFIGDRERLEQILFNIMQYSIRNTDSGIIELSLKNSENQIIIELKDTGCGISEKTISQILHDSNDRLFKDSTVADSADNKITNFLTIGLSKSNMVCKKMDGKLEIESIIGKGTTFRLILPLKASTRINRNFVSATQAQISDNSKIEDDSQICSQYSAEESVHINMPYFSEHRIFSTTKLIPIQKINRGIPVLIVDDNDFNRVVVKKMINKYTNNIEEAENGETAIRTFLAMASKNSKVLIFMDLDMPVMGGVEATRKIRELKVKNRPYITALTSFASEVERKACFEANMDWFLSKPLTKNNLEEVIAKFNNE